MTLDAPGSDEFAIAALASEVAAKSKVVWIESPDAPSYPTWFGWDDRGIDPGLGPTAYVMSGSTEPFVPEMPEEVHLAFRSADNGALVLCLPSITQHLDPRDPRWDRASEILLPRRLNAPPDLATLWRLDGEILAFTPRGPACQAPGFYVTEEDLVAVVPGPAATPSRLPWHLGSRARRGARAN